MSTRLFRARPARVVPAVIVAFALLAIAVALGWVAIAAIAISGGSGDAALSAVFPGIGELGSIQWGAGAIIAAGIVLAFVGLLFVIAAISPGAKRIIDFRVEAPEHIERLEVVAPTSALSHLAAAAADSVDGVSSVRAASNATSTNVSFSTPVRDNAEIRNDVDAAVTQRFAAIAFDRTPTVKVRALRRQS